jgi:hypothetical protein
MESMDHYYEEYVSKRQEELAELEEYLGKEFMEEVTEKLAEDVAQKIIEWEEERFRQYAQELEQASNEGQIEALKKEAEQEGRRHEGDDDVACGQAELLSVNKK